MGDWGVGNFDNDYARDLLAALVADWVERIENAFSIEKVQRTSFLERYGEYKIIPMIDILITLHTTYGEVPNIDKATYIRWKETYMNKFDSDEDTYSEEIKLKRRHVVLQTFQSLEQTF